jgi:pimeloyl-ACP methyl ester carboxylesterase
MFMSGQQQIATALDGRNRPEAGDRSALPALLPSARWQSRFADVAPDLRLHYTEAGPRDGPLIVLLHGFPEFSGSWRHQIGPLAEAGFHVVAPDQRGYNLSDKPINVANYSIGHLAGDVVELIRDAGHERATVVGHDWGGVVAWHLGMNRPDVVERLIILNAPHPAAYRREILRGRQLLLSWYVLLFQLPWLPEAALRANDFALVRWILRHDAPPGTFTHDDIERSIDALRPRQALTGALNYYRAALRPAGNLLRDLHRIRRPTLLLWGMRDRSLSPALTRDIERYAPRLTLRRFYEATHWLHHEIPEEVNREIIQFIAR